MTHRVIACPHCNSSAEKKSPVKYRCRREGCRKYFSVFEAGEREKMGKGPVPKATKLKPVVYRGKPAGRITIPQFNWNGTRLG